MVNAFKHGGWSVASLDIAANPLACVNVVVNPDQSMKSQSAALLEQTRQACAEYDAIISVAGGFSVSSIKDLDIIEKYEVQDRINF